MRVVITFVQIEYAGCKAGWKRKLSKNVRFSSGSLQHADANQKRAFKYEVARAESNVHDDGNFYHRSYVFIVLFDHDEDAAVMLISGSYVFHDRNCFFLLFFPFFLSRRI